MQRLTLRLIFDLCSPHTWPAASVLPVLFAGLLAFKQAGPYPLPVFAALLAASVLMHSAVNVLNDYYDFIKGADTLVDSPEEHDAALVYHQLEPRQVRAVGYLFLLLAFLLGLYITVSSNIIPFVIGMLGALVVLTYSAGPRPLSYLPLGEAVSALAMGGLLPLAVYAALSGALYPPLLYLCLPLMVGIALLMFTNNCCDIERDGRAGRRTLPILLGRARARRLYCLLLVLWPLLIALIAFPVGMLAPLPAAPALIKMWGAPLTAPGRQGQMRDILRLNLLLNGAYMLCLYLS